MTELGEVEIRFKRVENRGTLYCMNKIEKALRLAHTLMRTLPLSKESKSALHVVSHLI